MTVDSLRTTVNWENLGLKVVACAYDGQQGLEAIMKYLPDIIITDIDMPKTDGLSMVEQMKDKLEYSRIIFITGFNKFQFASRAIKLSAFDFLVKPIDNRELTESVKRAIASIEKERSFTEQKNTVFRRTQLLAALSGGKSEEAEKIFWQSLQTKPESYFFIAAENEEGLTRPILQRLDFVSFPRSVERVSTVIDGDLVIFCELTDRQESPDVLARNTAEILVHDLLDITVAIGGIHSGPEDLRLAYDESRRTLLWHDIYGRHAPVECFGAQPVDHTKHNHLAQLEDECNAMAKDIGRLDFESLWDRIWQESGGRLRIIRLMLMLICTRVMENKPSHFEWDDSIDITIYDITKLESVEESKDWLRRFLEELDKAHAPVSSGIVRGVLDYINSHVTEGLMLENVAAQFFVSPNYLSALIRKETGTTYRQHVILTKMEVARNMLDDTRMRVEDIAYAIGYENYISFYNVFRKTEGISPTEYRYRDKNQVKPKAEATEDEEHD